MVVRIPQVLVMWFPWLLFAGEVILVLTLGPRLIAAARARRNLPPLSLASRVGRCFSGSLQAILAWMVMMLFYFMSYAPIYLPQIDITVIIVLCFFLLAFSFLSFFIAARVCAGPIEQIDKKSFRRKLFVAPGLLILVCIWGFWGAFVPLYYHVRTLTSKAIDMTSLKGLGTGLLLYTDEHRDSPDRLGRLVDTGYISTKIFYIRGASRRIELKEQKEYQPGRVPKEFHYVHLPADAPGNLVWVWFDPTLYSGDPIPVLYKSGAVARVSPDTFCNELAKTYEWLLEQRGKSKTMPASRPSGHASK